MPFEGERAQYKSILRVTESDTVRAMLANCAVREYQHDKGLKLEPAQVKASSFLPRFVIAIDGGMQQLPARNGFPGAEFAYLTISSVILDVHKLKKLDEHRPIDPVEFANLSRRNHWTPLCQVATSFTRTKPVPGPRFVVGYTNVFQSRKVGRL